MILIVIIKHRKRWTHREDVLVLAYSMDDEDLSTLIQRTVAAIQRRRTRIRSEEYIEIQKRLAKNE